MGLQAGSYEAWCFDEALWFLGITIEHEMDEVSYKPSKKERSAQAARQRVLDKYIKPAEERGTGFADPAAFFGG